MTQAQHAHFNGLNCIYDKRLKHSSNYILLKQIKELSDDTFLSQEYNLVKHIYIVNYDF